MADHNEDKSVDGEETEGASDAAPVKGKRKLIIIIAGVVLLLGVGAGLYFGGIIGGSKEKPKAEKTETKSVAKPAYYDLPEFLVNLSSGTGKTSFLKMSVTLELKDEDSKALIDANKPRILDAFNTYLRELRPSDLSGSAGIYRLREELIARINSTIEEGLVKDILFSEIIIQ